MCESVCVRVSCVVCLCVFPKLLCIFHLTQLLCCARVVILSIDTRARSCFPSSHYDEQLSLHCVFAYYTLKCVWPPTISHYTATPKSNRSLHKMRYVTNPEIPFKTPKTTRHIAIDRFIAAGSSRQHNKRAENAWRAHVLSERNRYAPSVDPSTHGMWVAIDNQNNTHSLV